MTASNSTRRQAELDAARTLLDRLGITPEELVTATIDHPPVPTFRDYIPIVAATVTPGTKRTYSTYWERILARWGDLRLDEPTPTQIHHFATTIKAAAVQRRNGRDGRGAAENFIAALRCLYRHAEHDQLISESNNPARKTSKPRRLPSPRHALTDTQLAQINHVATTTGNDPWLDGLILRLHTETACRAGGALALRPIDLDPTHCLIRLREKGETVRLQPVSPTLMTHLHNHTHQRGAPPDGQLLRYRNRTPITDRRYNHLWNRLGTHLPWITTHSVSAHWLRHTTLTWVERNFGYAIAHAYAGHTNTTDNATATYVRADLREIATALAALTDEPHPLAHP
jgi:site-specific recombinase XerD